MRMQAVMLIDDGTFACYHRARSMMDDIVRPMWGSYVRITAFVGARHCFSKISPRRKLRGSRRGRSAAGVSGARGRQRALLGATARCSEFAAPKQRRRHSCRSNWSAPRRGRRQAPRDIPGAWAAAEEPHHRRADDGAPEQRQLLASPSNARAERLRDMGVPVAVQHARSRIIAGHTGGHAIGNAFEILDECKLDIDAVVTFLGERGYHRVGTMGSSLGAVKVVYGRPRTRTRGSRR